MFPSIWVKADGTSADSCYMGSEDILHRLEDVRASGHHENFLLVRMGTENNAVWPLFRLQGMAYLVALILRGLVVAVIIIVNIFVSLLVKLKRILLIDHLSIRCILKQNNMKIKQLKIMVKKNSCLTFFFLRLSVRLFYSFRGFTFVIFLIKRIKNSNFSRGHTVHHVVSWFPN